MVGNDMAGILQYSDQQRAVRQRVSEENRHHTTIETSGGAQTITVINEAGFYELVFGSKMPMAKEFQKWVTNEVLPELRKNGHYVMADSYAIINNQYQNFVSALQAEHIHWVNDYKRFVCDVVKMMNIRKINSMKNNEIVFYGNYLVEKLPKLKANKCVLTKNFRGEFSKCAELFFITN